MLSGFWCNVKSWSGLVLYQNINKTQVTLQLVDAGTGVVKILAHCPTLLFNLFPSPSLQKLLVPRPLTGLWRLQDTTTKWYMSCLCISYLFLIVIFGNHDVFMQWYWPQILASQSLLSYHRVQVSTYTVFLPPSICIPASPHLSPAWDQWVCIWDGMSQHTIRGGRDGRGRHGPTELGTEECLCRYR